MFGNQVQGRLRCNDRTAVTASINLTNAISREENISVCQWIATVGVEGRSPLEGVCVLQNRQKCHHRPNLSGCGRSIGLEVIDSGGIKTSFRLLKDPPGVGPPLMT